ncbi:toprim domain-containing protein [Polaribacter sp. R2A056_3_33]|uniref:toprim domain-containing protein n=1 Tax=Polaribacter sp. R2A056_3_33 TaxID=2745563 RepID=UPI001C4F32CE|nr:toprim domain-containing protein [Polaribacter sp. R2A056_3_33]QXP69206.1 toprim domain-containing protein [Polaribacter sp. R2A056_3_33]
MGKIKRQKEKKKKMNCKKVKQISLVSILDKIGVVKKKNTEREVWYLSPFSNEKTASFKVDTTRNIWFDFGSGKGGNVLDFIMLYYKCNIREALKILSNEDFIFSFHQHTNDCFADEKKIEAKILSIKPIKHPALINYLHLRRINISLAKKYCKEIHYYNYRNKSSSEKKCAIEKKKMPFFSIGFANDSGGYEVRNKFFKGCLKIKAMTTIKNNSDTLNLFEGFFDFISYLTLSPEKENEDFLIINSTALVGKTIKLLSNYNNVKVFFDTDDSGKKAMEIIRINYNNNFLDCSSYYKNHNDLNDFLISINKKENLKK